MILYMLHNYFYLCYADKYAMVYTNTSSVSFQDERHGAAWRLRVPALSIGSLIRRPLLFVSILAFLPLHTSLFITWLTISPGLFPFQDERHGAAWRLRVPALSIGSLIRRPLHFVSILAFLPLHTSLFITWLTISPGLFPFQHHGEFASLPEEESQSASTFMQWTRTRCWYWHAVAQSNHDSQLSCFGTIQKRSENKRQWEHPHPHPTVQVAASDLVGKNDWGQWR